MLVISNRIDVRPELTTQVAVQLAQCLDAPLPVVFSALGRQVTRTGAAEVVHRTVSGIGAEAASLAS